MIPPATRQAICAEYERGDLVKIIADRHGVSVDVPSRLAKEAGLPRRYRRDAIDLLLTKNERASLLKVARENRRSPASIASAAVRQFLEARQ